MDRAIFFVGFAWLVTAAYLNATKAQAPSDRPGCIFNSVLPTLSDKQQVAMQCDTNGRLQLH
jgi:hypothetical protein